VFASAGNSGSATLAFVFDLSDFSEAEARERTAALLAGAFGFSPRFNTGGASC
jgi:hypothetical protein